MYKFVKICFVGIIVFACACFGFKLQNNNDVQVDFFAQPVASATPSSYDLRDYIDIGVESQHDLGICYAFASLTSLETYLALNYGEYYDFSELHFAVSLYLQNNYYSSVNEALASGGNFTHFTLYTQKDKSIVLEQEMPMDKYFDMSLSTRATQLESDFYKINSKFYSLVKVNDTVSFPQYVGNKSQFPASELNSFRTQVKNHIMNYGSLTAGIHTSNYGFTFGTRNYKVTNDSLVTNQTVINSNINHLVSIVGWDDNYNAEGTWANKGAYICLNSWGKSFGDGGYFYVSYDDYFIESTIQGVSNATISTTNTKISSITNHQNKTAIYNHVFSENPTIYTANIFNTSNYVGQNITHIDSFIHGGLTKFYIKFFKTYDIALASINSVTSSSYISATRLNDYSLSTKYQLSSPLRVSNNYMVVVREIKDTKQTHSLAGNKNLHLNIEPTYLHNLGLGRFDITEDIWSPGVDGRDLDYTIPLIFHTDNYIKVGEFDSLIDSTISGIYIKNNATFAGKTLQFEIVGTSIDVNNISVSKLYTNNVNVTNNFQFNYSNNKLTITMINNLSGSFTEGEYLIKIPCQNTTIYRVIEVQDAVTYSISYNLDGGVVNNPTIYTNKHTSITLNTPVKNGYEFVGWYLDGEFTKPFNPNVLPYKNIELYAKYDFATPTITYKSNNINLTYYRDLNVDINIVASHSLSNQYNTLSYQWFKRASLSDEFEIINGATTQNLSLSNVSDSGYYSCEVTITITDPSLVDEPYVKTLSASAETSIHVNIAPYVYDISNVRWNYNQPISFNANNHTIELINLPDGVTAVYTNNSNTQVGEYIATAELIYDDMDGNATAGEIENLVWEIVPAKITITFNNIITSENISNDTIKSMISCSIENEYLPSDITTLEEKIEYLNIHYVLQPTSNNNLKIITCTTNSFDIYDIVINTGEYRIVVYNISDNNITASNEKGFVKDCKLTSSTYQPTSQAINLLKQQDLKLINAYNLEFSYLYKDTVSVNIPMSRNDILKGVSVYMLKDNKLTKLNITSTNQGISFTTTEQNGTYLIVENDLSSSSNSVMIVLVIIISIYIGLAVFAIISGLKHKDNFLDI